MNTLEHSPLPWELRRLGNDSFFIESPADLIKKPYGQEILADDYFDSLNKEADCRLILKSCNNHYALIDALKAFCKLHEDNATWDKTGSVYYNAKSLLNKIEKEQ